MASQGRNQLTVKPTRMAVSTPEPRSSIASLSAGLGGIRLHDIPGLLEGVLGVAYGKPLLFGA